MTLFRILFAFMLGVLQIFAQNQLDTVKDSLPNHRIVVKITNIKSEKGKIVVGLYDSETHFTQREHYRSALVQIKGNEVEVLFDQIPNGTYAVLCYHDENDNNQLDFDGFMPTEDYGSSNNPLLFGPPTFNATHFKVDHEDKNIDIRF